MSDVEALASRVEDVAESMAGLQLMLEDQGWVRIGEQASEFTRDSLIKAAQLCRVMAIANPLIKRGLAIRANYVWGQGVGITARAIGEDGGQDINSVVQSFLDDDANRAAFTGHTAHIDIETALGTDGNVFIALFTSPLTGRVQARQLPFEELEKITDPDDRTRTWFYRRKFSSEVFDTTTGTSRHVTDQVVYYPDIRYRPITRQRHINGHPVRWDAPIIHIKDNGLSDWKYGIGDAYAALPWARAYKEFLEDWARLMKSLSRIAWKVNSADRSKAQAARAGIQGAINAVDGAGGIANLGGQTTLEAVPKTGATLDAESGRPLATMVASALGLPVTTLTADPGQTGARAVAETLNQPTRLEFQGRRELWTEAYRSILGYVIDQAVIAPRGPLRGSIVRDGDELAVTLAGGTDRTLEIVWPDLDEIDPKIMVDAIVAADGTQKLPPLTVAQLLLRALGVRDVDEILTQLTDDQGNFVPPTDQVGQALVDQYRRGNTPGGDPE